MKILVITHLFSPDRGGGASVFSDLCFGLAERGHDVAVFAGYPYYPEWRNKSGADLRKIKEEWIEGVRVRRHGFYIPKNPGSLLQRLVYELSFAVSLMRSLGRERDCDVTMVYCPLFGSVIFALVRKFLCRDRLWLNIQDIPADAANAAGFTRNPVFKWLSNGVQSALFRQGNIVSTISPVMVRRVDAIIRGNGRTICMPNWLNRSMEQCIAAVNERPREAAGEPVLLYAGNIGKKQGLLEFCQLLSRRPERFIFRIFGEGGEAVRLAEWIRSAGDRRFVMNSFLPEDGFVRALADADFFVITETASVGASFIPSKLIPCIAVGTPVVAICDAKGPLGEEVRSHGLGLVRSWGAVDALLPELNERFVHRKEYEDLRRNCRRRARAYGRESALLAVERAVARLRGGTHVL